MANLLCILAWGCLFSFCFASPLCDSELKINTRTTVFDGELYDIKWSPKTNTAPNEGVFVRTSKGSAYRSVDMGKTFNRLDLGSPVRRIVLTVDPKKIYLIGVNGRSWVSENQGETFQLRTQDINFVSIIPHPTEVDWALGMAQTAGCSSGSADPCHQDMYITKNLGASWTVLTTYVAQATWGDAGADGIPKGTILFSSFEEKTGDQRSKSQFELVFHRTEDLAVTMKLSRPHVVAFLFHKRVLFVVQPVSGDSGSGLRLYTSKNGGQTFNLAEFPKDSGLTERRYTIVDLEDDVAFVNVDHSDDASWGNTYSSDALETAFVESLKFNRRSGGAVDFRRVKGLRGIYLANQLLMTDADDDEGGTQSKTLISLDRGGIWKALKPPTIDSDGKHIDCSGCSLNLLGITSSQFGQFYSTENAIGLVIATGNVGPFMEERPDEINTYFSRDAGATWKELRKGPFTFEYADHGAIILMAKTDAATESILYSWDQGVGFTECIMGDESFEVANIITEPSNKGKAFLVYGIRDNGNGIIVHVDFEDFHERECVFPDDYEIWSPSDAHGGGCLLGEKISYTRRKSAADCFNPKDFEAHSEAIPCPCTRDDFECDYCYFPTNDDPPKCKVEWGCPPEPIEPSPCVDFWYQTQGYRLVPGDRCTPEGSTAYSQYAPIKRNCSKVTTGGGHHTTSGGGLSGGAVFGILLLAFILISATLLIIVFVAIKTSDSFRLRVKGWLPASFHSAYDGITVPTPKRGGRGYMRVGQAGEGNSILDDLGDDDDNDLMSDEPEELDDKAIKQKTSAEDDSDPFASI